MKNQDMKSIREQQSAYALDQMRAGCAEVFRSFFHGTFVLFADHPEAAKYETEVREGRLTFSVTPHPDDAGRLIGARGKMFHSHLTLLRQLASRHGVRGLHYRLGTDKDKPSRPGAAYVERPDWPKEALEAAFKECCGHLLQHPFKLKGEDSGSKTHYLLAISAKEPLHVTNLEFGDALGTLWHSTARANGRLVFVEHVERRESL